MDNKSINNKVNIIAEIGINHNGSMDLCKQLIRISKDSGCDYVKIQKRNPDICVPEHQKKLIKKTPWGDMTYLDYKYKLEFSEDQILELINYSNSLGIIFFASVWDIDSAKLMAKYTDIVKIPSALITDLELCQLVRKLFKFVIISTGMSSEEEIQKCVSICDPDVIMHTNSTYPCPVEDLNLNYIHWLKQKYINKIIGYSGHEFGLVSTFASVAMGAKWIERHITIDRNMWGSDQLASVEPTGLYKLVKGIRDIEKATQYYSCPRIQFPSEEEKKKSLRK
jgi:N-acetylneuraminate synthase